MGCKKTVMMVLRRALQIMFVAGFLLSNAQSRMDSKRPNIICILVDDLGYGDLSVMGATDMQTPNIDKLANEGLTFTHFYANSTVCSPSRASLLSGRYPDLVGVPGVIRQSKENNWGHLTKDATLIPEVLKASGYHTAMIGKWHLGFESPNTPNKKGFDYFKGFLGDMMDDYYTHLRGGVNWMRYNDEEIHPEGHATDIFTDWTIDYLNEQKNEDKPFFLYLAYNAPHFPIQPPQQWMDKVMEREFGITEKRAANVALIEHLDDNIGRLMRVLKETNLDENTLVIFTSDNGGSLPHAQSNGKLHGGKLDMYEGGIRVPTFLYWKNKIQPGTITNNFAMLMDLFPTFCELANVESSSEVDGICILPTLMGKNQVTNDRVVFWVRRDGYDVGGLAYYAARYKEYKILQNSPFEPFQFFNLKDDEYETNAMEPLDNKMYRKLKISLQEHIRKAGAIPWQKNGE
jgi:arylsulfatase A-like enzyme